ncbi:hypothetical protein ON010_g19118 [Phytophthora cinnamomi]|nr:hypothetical protein ON010_g19118 [Phytophthora cinnamomi]
MHPHQSKPQAWCVGSGGLNLSALGAVSAGVIDYDNVQPFPEPEPKTISEKAAIKYKPSLLITSGYHSYAAVNAAGDTSGGLDPKASDAECKGPTLGSQVYSRSAWYRDIWVIIYAWYFPKNSSDRNPNPTVRHD